MKFLILLLSLLISFQSFGAFTATTVWEIRSTATAANANGGGFDSALGGSDLTLNDNPSYTGSNLASTVGTTNPCVVTSASHNFVTADQGNTIHITAGTNWTQGWYQIVSTAANAATLDRACGTAASISSGTFAVGGAISLGSATANQNDDSFFENGVAGNKFWIKNGTYTLGATVSLAATGSTTKPIVIEGYNSSRGDKPTGSTRPIIGTGTAAWVSAANWEYYNLQWTGTGTNVISLSASNKIGYCKLTNSSTTASRGAIGVIAGGTNTFIFMNEAISYRGRALNAATSNDGSTVWGNYFHDSDVGIMTSSTTTEITYINNIIAGCVTAAIQVTGTRTGGLTISGNTIYGAENKLGIGISLATGTTNTWTFNNILYGLASGVTHADAQTVSYDNFNNYFNNTSDVTNWTKGTNDTAVNPGFGSITQYTGATATTSGSVLTQAGATFPTFVPGVDFLYLASGTGITAGVYGITSNTGTTITLDIAPGTSATADKVFSVTTGHNFAVSYTLNGVGAPGIFPGALTTGYLDIGAAQRRMAPAAGAR